MKYILELESWKHAKWRHTVHIKYKILFIPMSTIEQSVHTKTCTYKWLITDIGGNGNTGSG